MPGAVGEPDHQGCWTGSVIRAHNRFHIFYTGWNPALTPSQTICHAVSDDCVRWTKDPANPILAPDPERYALSDWRDPFVFWNPDEACYWMLITAKLAPQHSALGRGCLALAKSPDLSEWRLQPPLWLYESFHPPECPDLLALGERLVLLFSDVFTMHRTAPGLAGPWCRPADSRLDDQGFYAAKTFHCGDRHVLVGWIASHAENKDAGARLWGGALSLPRDLSVDDQGRLRIACAPEVRSLFTRAPLHAERQWRVLSGEWTFRHDGITADPSRGDALAVLADLPKDYRAEVQMTLAPNARAGIILRLSDAGDSGYLLTLDQSRQRLAFRRWEGCREGRPIYERPVQIRPEEPFKVEIFLRGTVLEVFVADAVALSARCYDRPSGHLALYATTARVTFTPPAP